MGIPSATRLAAVFEKAELMAMSLTFKHLCDIYQPNALSSVPNSGEGADFSRNPVAAHVGVACWYEPTPIFDEAHPQGLQEEVNIFTSDRWSIPANVSIAAGWIIVMKTVGHPLYGRSWVVEGNSTMNDYAPIQIPQRQWVFAKLSPTSMIPT